MNLERLILVPLLLLATGLPAGCTQSEQAHPQIQSYHRKGQTFYGSSGNENRGRENDGLLIHNVLWLVKRA